VEPFPLCLQFVTPILQDCSGHRAKGREKPEWARRDARREPNPTTVLTGLKLKESFAIRRSQGPVPDGTGDQFIETIVSPAEHRAARRIGSFEARGVCFS
jgi:hypothetical protein